MAETWVLPDSLWVWVESGVWVIWILTVVASLRLGNSIHVTNAKTAAKKNPNWKDVVGEIHEDVDGVTEGRK